MSEPAGIERPLFPEGAGELLRAVLDPPVQAGPPYTHTVRPPEPLEELVEDEDIEMMLAARISLLHSLTWERRQPVFTGCLAFLAEEEQR